VLAFYGLFTVLAKGRMNFIAYQQLFGDILTMAEPPFPYNDAHYLNYAKLNWSRQERWFKVGVLNPELVELIAGITTPQTWTIITEPWCGDAAHSLPFVHRLALLNPLITEDYQQRDSEPFLIDSYLTGTSKSIPKLIIRDSENQDLAVWGARPAACQLLYHKLIRDEVEMDQRKIALQQWYNTDKGVSLQEELVEIFIKIKMSIFE
jgi:hypothetical protein